MRNNLRVPKAERKPYFYICWIGNFTSGSVSRFRLMYIYHHSRHHKTIINDHHTEIRSYKSSSLFRGGSLGKDLLDDISSVGKGQSSEGSSEQVTSTSGKSLSDDLGSSVDALDGDVFFVEAVSLVGVDGLAVSLDNSALLGEVSLLGESDVVSGGGTGLFTSSLGGIDGNHAPGVGEARVRVLVSVDEVERISRELDSVSLDEERVVVSGEFPKQVAHVL